VAACSDLLVLEILRHHRCASKVGFAATSNCPVRGINISGILRRRSQTPWKADPRVSLRLRQQALSSFGYRRVSDKQKIAEAFQVRVGLDDLDFMPNEDITPGTMQPLVFTNNEGARDLELMYWGFTFRKRLTFNTRSDSILKPSLWKNSFEDRRCIVPADSFFEWKRLHKKNNPKYEISVPGRQPFALAGIWSVWKNKAGDSLPTVSVITSAPNEGMAKVHAIASRLSWSRGIMQSGYLLLTAPSAFSSNHVSG
jgi:putative SOS response-associated peptidase YedK